MPHSNAQFDVALQSSTQLEVKIDTPFQNKQVLATQLESKPHSESNQQPTDFISRSTRQESLQFIK